jgi:hypothetical protein
MLSSVLRSLRAVQVNIEILVLRGHKVLLDADLAEMYSVENAVADSGCEAQSGG